MTKQNIYFWIGGILILLYTFYVFSGIIHFDFIVWDDDKEITGNALIKTLNKGTFIKLFQYDRHTSLTLLTYAIDYKIWGLNPAVFHFNSLILHLINCVLAFFLSYKLIRKRNLALFVMMLFALHPMRVESVAWAVERKDLLFALFYMLALLFYIKFLEKKNYFSILWVFIFALLSSLSKIQGLTLPVVLFLFDWLYKRKLTTESILEKIFLIFLILGFGYFDEGNIFRRIFPVLSAFTIFFYYPVIHNKFGKFSRYLIPLIAASFFSGYVPHIIALFLILLLIRTHESLIDNAISSLLLFFQKNKSWIIFLFLGLLVAGVILFQFVFPYWNNSDRMAEFSLYHRLFLASWSLLYYLCRFVYPFNLNAINPYPKMENGSLPSEYYYSFVVALVFIIIVAFLIYKYLKNERLIIFSVLFFLVNIFLVLHIVPIQGRLIVGDRYTYLPYLGLFITAGILFFKMFEKVKNSTAKYLVLSVSLLIVFGMGLVSMGRTEVWKNSITLFDDVISKNDKISFAYGNRGGVYLGIKEYEKAKSDISIAMKLDSNEAINYYNRGLLYFELFKTDSAITDFHKSISLATTEFEKAVSYNDLAMTWFRKGNVEKTMSCFDSSIHYMKHYSKPYGNRGWVKFNMGDSTGARKDYIEALRYNPDNAETYGNMGYLKLRAYDFNGALRDFNKAVQLAPQNAMTYNNRGWVYFVLQDFNAARRDFEKAISLNPKFEQAYMNMGYSSFYLKDFKSAIKDYSKAIEINPLNQTAYSNRGWSYYQLNDFKQALEDLNKTISLNDSSADFYMLRAMTYYKLKDEIKAESDMNKAKNIAENNKEALHRLSGFYFEMQRKKEACHCLEISMKLGSKNAESDYNSKCVKQN